MRPTITRRVDSCGRSCVQRSVRRPSKLVFHGAVLLLLLWFFASVGPAVANPYDLQIANEVRSGPDSVDASNWIAQAIVPVQGFFVSRVSLYVANAGTGVLAVSIRQDSGGVPGSTNLTQAIALGSSTASWVDFNLSFTQLAAGKTYWIVAQSTAPGGQGYEWWNSGDLSAYPPGVGMTSSNGISWSPRGKDYAFRVYGFMQPAFNFSVSSQGVNLAPGQSTAFRINFTNAGSGSAAALWVNVTLPNELTYLADTSGSIGGIRSGAYSFLFTNVTPGAYSFAVSVVAKSGVSDGTFATTNFTFDPSDHNGVPLGRSTQTIQVRFTTPGPLGSIGTWWWVFALIAGLGGLVFAIARRRFSTVAVEQVFVADRAGLLIAHRSTTLIPYEDEDILMGMFKAVQDFVRDAFSGGRKEEMRALEFGERKIMIERGASHSVVVVYSGHDRGDLADRVRNVSSEIDKRFGKTLASWDGDVEVVRDITLLLPNVWRQPNRRNSPGRTSPSA
jgi:hypothetical protein